MATENSVIHVATVEENAQRASAVWTTDWCTHVLSLTVDQRLPTHAQDTNGRGRRRRKKERSGRHFSIRTRNIQTGIILADVIGDLGQLLLHGNDGRINGGCPQRRGGGSLADDAGCLAVNSQRVAMPAMAMQRWDVTIRTNSATLEM